MAITFIRRFRFGLVGSALSGSLNGNALTGTLEGSKVHFVVKDSQNTTYVLSGFMKLNQITGSLIEFAPTTLLQPILGGCDEATRLATSGMVQSLEQDYGLTPSESAQVLGSSAEYVIAEIADRDAGVILKIRKDNLKALNSR